MEKHSFELKWVGQVILNTIDADGLSSSLLHDQVLTSIAVSDSHLFFSFRYDDLWFRSISLQAFRDPSVRQDPCTFIAANSTSNDWTDALRRNPDYSHSYVKDFTAIDTVSFLNLLVLLVQSETSERLSVEVALWQKQTAQQTSVGKQEKTQTYVVTPQGHVVNEHKSTNTPAATQVLNENNNNSNSDNDNVWKMIEHSYLYRDLSMYYEKTRSSTSNSHLANKPSKTSKSTRSYVTPKPFLSKSLGASSVVASATPYFISVVTLATVSLYLYILYMLNESVSIGGGGKKKKTSEYGCDETVDIVNLKPQTTFRQSCLSRDGQMLAFLDNMDGILVLQKKPWTTEPEEVNLPVSLWHDQLSGFTPVIDELIPFQIKRDNNKPKQQQQKSKNDKLPYQKPHYDKDSSIAWDVLLEFSPTPIMHHLKPLDMIAFI
ncbi:hypothetical protein RFI_26925 [Reticulomyxa filosa]|uniref:Uncharacterized protein n=1 Tax=Reticulomyxa filosa TaxID=46433 RepID=X6M9A4_RETFI|nr:hypothetical protein RFI_26925 [Reticulomyxa filosa]|eukprot:ETO10454.1 hypothetical protein RFI_26925 [Reticulomyxa filosa]